MSRHDSHGRRFVDGPIQLAFRAIIFVIVLPLLLVGLLVSPPAKRWADPRYRW